MQLGDVNNWYMWWKKTGYPINWSKFKNEFFKRFQCIKEEYFFIELTRLQQKGSVDDFTCEWEALATRLLGLST
jgi:hypothetical protein